LLDKLFKALELSKIISFAKEERIDKQYRVESQQKFKVTEELCKEMILKAENFLVEMRLLMSNLNQEGIDLIRKSFENLFE